MYFKFEKYPKPTLLVISLILLIVCLVLLEIGVRMLVSFSPPYYSSYPNSNIRLIRYPYGDIPINDAGFPDSEISPTKIKKRIAYVGDSVCYGVGAGYGYRISELLENALPEFEHINMAVGLDTGMSYENTTKVVTWAENYEIDKVIYLFNLNDLLPSAQLQSNQVTFLGAIKSRLDFLRGRSYLYTYIVYKLVGSYLVNKFNLTHTGHIPNDFFPSETSLNDTIERIVALHVSLKKQNVDLAVLLLPYEMHISQQAERVYKNAGLTWDEAFITRSTQHRIQSALSSAFVTSIDAYTAFIGPDAVASSRDQINVGEYYVYNLGDRLDWNHPNRLGHAAIAQMLMRNALFKSFLETGTPTEQKK